MGCRSGCEFCYQRGGRYLGRRDPDTYDTLIQVKVNAVDILRKELARLWLLVRDLCERHGLLDCMPRYIAPGPLAVNKQIAERLFLKSYDMELEQAYGRCIWAYRKAAWTVVEWPQSVARFITPVRRPDFASCLELAHAWQA